MADSKRLRILKAITTQLETVATTAGYQHNLLGKVFRGRADYGAETPLPWVGIFELRPEEVTRAGESFNKDRWYIGIQGAIAAAEDHPTDSVHNLMADVKKAIGGVLKDLPHQPNPSYMFGNLVGDLELDGGLTFTPKENPDIAVFALRLTVTLTENLENPYAQ